MKLQITATDYLTQRLKTRHYVTPFPSSDDRLGLTDFGSEFGLRQSSTEAGFSD